MNEPAAANQVATSGQVQAAPADQGSRLSTPVAGLLRIAPNAIVLAALAGMGYWGHHTGWRVPNFSELAGQRAAGDADWCEEPDAIVVPNEAVHWEGCCHVAFVRDKNYLKKGSYKVFHTRMVRPGVTNGDYTEMIAGLLPSEVVVTQSGHRARAGRCGDHHGRAVAAIHRHRRRIDPDRVIKYGLTFDEVVEALKENNPNVGGGNITQNSQMLLVHGVGRTVNIPQIENIVIKAKDGVPIRVRDVATCGLVTKSAAKP